MKYTVIAVTETEFDGVKKDKYSLMNAAKELETKTMPVGTLAKGDVAEFRTGGIFQGQPFLKYITKLDSATLKLMATGSAALSKVQIALDAL